MANDGLADIVIRAHSPAWIDEAAFLAFLLLAFVGLTPFAVAPPTLNPLNSGLNITGAGDLMRQICYLAVFAAIVVGAFRHRGLAAFSSVPVLMLLLLAWCLASTSWAGEPGVAVRRAGLAVVLVVSIMLSVDTVGTERSLVLWRWVLVGVLIVNFVSIPLIPQARHLPGEADPGLVGDWRGLYDHKNIAGAVTAMTAIIFLYTPHLSPGLYRRLRDWAIVAAALAFTVMTRSKSSLGLVVIALAIGAVYRWAWKKDLDRTIVVVAGLALAIAVAAILIADQGAIARFLEDPNDLTGRTAIWQAEIAFIRDHPLFGAGFGTFADTGGLSPLHNYVGNDWVSAVSHGHNGYLQLLVTVGAIGFVLAMAGLIAAPLISFWSRGGDIDMKALLFALFAFLVLHNFMESDFLEGDGVTWVGFLLVLAMLYNLERRGELP
ncbi:MAG: O-antigen ligase family protein [Alphaproteobacteria bacterium]|nr:O-antigen ligase family protein [Alphaproteobacteria bacterium]MDE2111231.1 O-antigen ligase family protein [Alphaproteobacteria bacterium]